MIRSCRTYCFALTLLFSFSASAASAETIELVTYYPAAANSNMDRVHASRATVGNTPYSISNPADAALTDGTLLVSDRLWIGPNFTAAAPPFDPLHVEGVDNEASNVLFMPGAGTGTIRVGIGTANPQAPLQVGASNLFVQPDQGGSLEIGGTAVIANPTVNGTPYIDFHFGTGAAQDFNARIINSGNNQLAIQTASGGSVLTVNGANVGIGNAYAPGTAVPNRQPGNLDVNDIFLRGVNRWASQGAAGTWPLPRASGEYTGTGVGGTNLFVATNAGGTPFHPVRVIIWNRHDSLHIHMSETWDGLVITDPEIAAADRPFCSFHHSDSTNVRRTYLRIVAGENGFRVGGGDLHETNSINERYFWWAW